MVSYTHELYQISANMVIFDIKWDEVVQNEIWRLQTSI